jgi:hypothetical protein
MATSTGSHQDGAAFAGGGIVGWRREQLLASAFPSGLSDRLARDWRFDLHALIELAERGCPPALAARILGPLDDATTHDTGGDS